MRVACTIFSSKREDRLRLNIIKASFDYVFGLHYFSSKREDRLRLNIIKASFAYVFGLHYLCSS